MVKLNRNQRFLRVPRAAFRANAANSQFVRSADLGAERSEGPLSALLTYPSLRYPWYDPFGFMKGLATITAFGGLASAIVIGYLALISTLPSNGWRVVLASMFYRIGISYVG
jgi:hypothetical protein